MHARFQTLYQKLLVVCSDARSEANSVTYEYDFYRPVSVATLTFIYRPVAFLMIFKLAVALYIYIHIHIPVHFCGE